MSYFHCYFILQEQIRRINKRKMLIWLSRPQTKLNIIHEIFEVIIANNGMNQSHKRALRVLHGDYTFFFYKKKVYKKMRLKSSKS